MFWICVGSCSALGVALIGWFVYRAVHGQDVVWLRADIVCGCCETGDGVWRLDFGVFLFTGLCCRIIYSSFIVVKGSDSLHEIDQIHL